MRRQRDRISYPVPLQLSGEYSIIHEDRDHIQMVRKSPEFVESTGRYAEQYVFRFEQQSVPCEQDLVLKEKSPNETDTMS